MFLRVTWIGAGRKANNWFVLAQDLGSSFVAESWADEPFIWDHRMIDPDLRNSLVKDKVHDIALSTSLSAAYFEIPKKMCKYMSTASVKSRKY